jgi:hypothetical protein
MGYDLSLPNVAKNVYYPLLQIAHLPLMVEYENPVTPTLVL